MGLSTTETTPIVITSSTRPNTKRFVEGQAAIVNDDPGGFGLFGHV